MGPLSMTVNFVEHCLYSYLTERACCCQLVTKVCLTVVMLVSALE